MAPHGHIAREYVGLIKDRIEHYGTGYVHIISYQSEKDLEKVWELRGRVARLLFTHVTKELNDEWKNGISTLFEGARAGVDYFIGVGVGKDLTLDYLTPEEFAAIPMHDTIPKAILQVASPTECIVCAKPHRFVCGRCKSVRYCGRDCQASHYATHKGVCLLMSDTR